jgi:hypothetical protein
VDIAGAAGGISAVNAGADGAHAANIPTNKKIFAARKKDLCFFMQIIFPS